jgi:hypothetical protein
VELRGVIVRIRFRSQDSFWTVAELRPSSPESRAAAEAAGALSDAGTLAVVGPLVGVGEQDEVELRGSWATSDRFGKQLKIESAELQRPSDERGMAAWLEEHLDGVGPGRALRIVEAWGRGPDGLDGLWTALAEPDAATRLQVFGLSERQAGAAVTTLQEQAQTRETEAWLRGLGLGSRGAARALEAFGAETRTVLEADPYRLMELERFGFLTADGVARTMGLPTTHPCRSRAAVLHALQQAADGEGHTYLPVWSPDEVCRLPAERRKMHPGRGLLDRCQELGVGQELVWPALRELSRKALALLGRDRGDESRDEEISAKTLRCSALLEGVEGQERVALLSLRQAEQHAAELVRELLASDATNQRRLTWA